MHILLVLFSSAAIDIRRRLMMICLWFVTHPLSSSSSSPTSSSTSHVGLNGLMITRLVGRWFCVHRNHIALMLEIIIDVLIKRDDNSGGGFIWEVESYCRIYIYVLSVYFVDTLLPPTLSLFGSNTHTHTQSTEK